MTQAAVSIILPVFNRLHLLAATVESVFAQTYNAWELIVADDGSGPETKQYLASLADQPRVKVLHLDHCGIPAAVRNAGIRAATTEYVAFLDSDDLWLPQKLQKQMQALRLNPSCGWSYTGCMMIDASGRQTGGKSEIPAFLEGKIFDHLVREEAPVVTSSVVLRLDVLRQLGGFSEELMACEDYDLWLRLAPLSDVTCIGETLVLLRRHGEHSFDDVACLRSLQHILESMQASNAAPHLAQRITERRMQLSVNLARAYAIKKQRARMLGVISASAVYSWRHLRWWLGGLAATMRAFSPQIALDVGRKWRSRLR
jgi:glycosyltransferase involved in cell wall biosynthesis